jgi:hypothetical protein
MARRRTRGVHGGHELVHVGHIGISSGTWRALGWPPWDQIFSIFQAYSDPGAYSKVAALLMIYKIA